MTLPIGSSNVVRTSFWHVRQLLVSQPVLRAEVRYHTMVRVTAIWNAVVGGKAPGVTISMRFAIAS